jgi:hypothetical protein
MAENLQKRKHVFDVQSQFCKALSSDQFAMLASGLCHLLTTQAVMTTSQLELRNVFCVQSKIRHEADRDERLASSL